MDMVYYQHLGYSFSVSHEWFNYSWILITTVTYFVFLHFAINQCFSVKGDLPLREPLEVSGDIFGHHGWQGQWRLVGRG